MKNQRFMRFPEFKRKALTLSYDDGVKFDKIRRTKLPYTAMSIFRLP